MPLFFLHLRVQGELIPDEEGFDLPDVAAATEEAVRGARSIMSADVQQGRLHLGQSIEIADGTGQLLTKVRFEHALVIVGVNEGVDSCAAKSGE